MKKKRFSKEQIHILKQFWVAVEHEYEKFTEAINRIEDTIGDRLELDILIHIVDNEPVGYGTWDREYELLHMPEGKYLEEL